MATSSEGAPPRRRRWPRRLLIAANIFIALCVVTLGSGYLYLRWRFGQIPKIHLEEGVLYLEGDDPPGEPMNVLLVGSDSRANLTGADCKRNCRDERGRLVTGRRSDTMMVLHIDPKATRAAILSIPRDLWVTIAGSRQRQRINTAFERGPDVLIRTITNELGLKINHYVEVDFVGFRRLVGAVGGVPIYVPAPARDRYSDLRIPQPGCITLNGDQALAWVRSRHYQYFEAGRWRTDPRSDFARILRQQDFIRRLMKKSISRGIRNPLRLDRMINIASDNVTIDAALSSKDILKLGRRFRSLEPNSVEMITLPVVSANVGGAAVLRLKQPEAQEVIDRFNGTAPTAAGTRVPTSVLPNQVRVRILNGSGASGLAGQVATALTRFSFGNAGIGDAKSFGLQRSVIRFAPGQNDKALLLRAYLKSGADLREDRGIQGVDVVLTVGADYTGVARPGAAPPAAPATTATTVAVQTPVPVPKGAPPAPDC